MKNLTQTVKKGGCAAKVPAIILREILNGLTFPPKIPGLLVDGSDFDDAAILAINDEISLVQTLDFFTPIVDLPRDFGAIAAANALSDVYAMGGKPKTCMAILAAPLATMEPSVIQEVLQGACDVISAAGASLVGGHSIDDDTLKFGLSVTGFVNPQRTWTNQGAKPGDVLILTKPLGTGTVCAGIKRQELTDVEAQEAISSMKRLNNAVDFLSENEIKAIRAATDVTGFGLMGHGYQLAKASNVTLSLIHKDLPLLKEAKNCLSKGFLTKAHKSNEEYTRSQRRFAEGISEIDQLLYFDPQTSGGLLLSVDPAMATPIVEALRTAFPGTCVIGKVKMKENVHVIVE
ncbi:MAG TPA: selenide, water dikinase SelD [Bacteriovoracaceae bacterium]|nr:selenide, water dikinase SelD [Bacteriovoracaceae bacterium]